jgi:hypothetical protein
MPDSTNDPNHLAQFYTPMVNGLFDLRDLLLSHMTKMLQIEHPNPMNRYGKKCFSQTDEDGITLEILRRINNTQNGVYAEFGVGDGTENNTLILAALGWKGFWVGGEDLKFNVDGRNKNFAYFKEWITLENIIGLAKTGLTTINAQAIDVISIDLDGNDIYLVEALLKENFRPRLFIVEYNAKFPPPVEFKIAYDPRHAWQGDDYFGASLASFNKLFAQFKYRLICCNSHTGSNAFFIDEAYSEFFSDVPAHINQIYVEPRYHLYLNYGHGKSIKTINRIFNKE